MPIYRTKYISKRNKNWRLIEHRIWERCQEIFVEVFGCCDRAAEIGNDRLDRVSDGILLGTLRAAAAV